MTRAFIVTIDFSPSDLTVPGVIQQTALTLQEDLSGIGYPVISVEPFAASSPADQTASDPFADFSSAPVETPMGMIE